MAVATPVFERKLNSQQTTREESARSYDEMSADDFHNSCIKDNFARLLNPENKIKDIVASIDAKGTQTAQPVAAQVQPAAQEVRPAAEAPVLLVRNARADSDLFRADSPVNARQEYMGVQAYAAPAEEESEDLRPTQTTIQYQTIGADGAAIPAKSFRTMEEGEIVRPAEQEKTQSRLTLKKRDKIILGVIVALILTVFALIIVNSAVISNLNSDITELEGRAQTARAEYDEVNAEYESVTSPDYVLEAAREAGLID